MSIVELATLYARLRWLEVLHIGDVYHCGGKYTRIAGIYRDAVILVEGRTIAEVVCDAAHHRELIDAERDAEVVRTCL